jgi:hypothetical protein
MLETYKTLCVKNSEGFILFLICELCKFQKIKSNFDVK